MHTGIQIAAWLFPVMIVLALAIEPVSKRLGIPFNALLVLTGFIASELVTGMGYDLGLRWENFRDLVLYLLVPALVFAAALTLDARALLRHLPSILVLAIPLFLLSVAIGTVLLYLGIGHASGFPWLTAAVAATLIAATDPSAVIAMLKRYGVSERIVILVEGESLFNDAIAIVLFGVLTAGVTASTHILELNNLSGIAMEFARVFIGGSLMGALLGAVGYWLLRRYRRDEFAAALSLALAYLAYASAETLGGLSGVMSVLMCGLALGMALHDAGSDFVGKLWGLLSFLAGSIAFLLVGVTVTPSLFSEGWWALCVGIAAALITRAIAVYLTLPLFERLPGMDRLAHPDRRLLFGAGQRGAVTAALALSLPVVLTGWWTAQAIGYGVVLFTLFVQEPLFGYVLRRQKH